jgi:RNA polymerase sigma factor (sigma-70 family)
MVLEHFLAGLGSDANALTDGELLSRFVKNRDEDALALLVRRHAPMVWGVCRRLLTHHDAEDAFQATFLVLVRKAASVPRRAVANWLYGVARQTAVRLRSTAAKRGRRETQVVSLPETAVTEVGDADMQAVLDLELSRLPNHYRSVLILCDLEGMTRKQAAHQLNIPEGSVASRLARARTLLAKRLTRRGTQFTGGSLVGVLCAESASTSAAPALIATTIRTASLLVAGRCAGVVSVQVALLTEGVVQAMRLSKLKSASAVLLIAVLLGVGASSLLADNPAEGVGYQVPGIKAAPVDDDLVVHLGEMSLDANAGVNNPSFRQSDPLNIDQQWELRKTGDDYMILPKVSEGELALDACAGRGKPYFREADAANINHLWKFVKFDHSYLIMPKVGDGKLALNANGGKGNPTLGKPDVTDANYLWELRNRDKNFIFVPLVTSNKDRGLGADLQQEFDKIAHKVEVAEAIDALVNRAELAGTDRNTTLDAIEKAVRDLKAKGKKK